MNRNLNIHHYLHCTDCFRPQQGLTIMNIREMPKKYIDKNGFRPQQGLTIMNGLQKFNSNIDRSDGFRPQQGLTIMNIEIYAIENRVR